MKHTSREGRLTLSTNASRRILSRYSYPIAGHTRMLAPVFWGVFLLFYTYQVAYSEPDWKDDWAVPAGFSLSIDTEGYQLPTSIVFVPNPGTRPKDPLYFVTELRGRVKVVTNDRTVVTFVEDFFHLDPIPAYGQSDSQAVGLAGICLEPDEGYVFLTFAYQDEEQVLRNNIVRFQTLPETFSVIPSSKTFFTEIFLEDESHPSHQIGPCQVHDGLLYVNLGDGEQVPQSQNLESTLGKVLRMTLDGDPVPDNPFYQASKARKTTNYIWAYGLRNPFGLKIVNGRVFVADNGRDVDRFLEIQKGGNYLWDGTDRSISTNAIVFLTPAEGVAQVEHYPGNSSTFPEFYPPSFFLTITGSPGLSHVSDPPPHLLAVEYGFEENRVLSVPRPILRYIGQDPQVLPAVGLGPDGLYFAPMLPNRTGMNAVFKLTWDPANQHSFLLEEVLNPRILMREWGCLSCHSINNLGGDVGPALDREALVPRLEARLNSEEYLRSLTALDSSDQEPFVSTREARKEIIENKGQERLRLWLKHRILEPKFDNPGAQMPNLGLSEEQALALAGFLLEGEITKESVFDKIKDLIPRSRRYVLALGLLLGFLLATFSFAFFLFIRKALVKLYARRSGG